jgi:hypothetical protein
VPATSPPFGKVNIKKINKFSKSFFVKGESSDPHQPPHHRPPVDPPIDHPFSKSSRKALIAFETYLKSCHFCKIAKNKSSFNRKK